MNSDKKVFDKEHVSKPIIFLKGIGRYCPICKKHIFGRKDKIFCSEKCRWKKRDTERRRTGKDIVGIHAFISLQKHGNTKPYRIIKLYLKKVIIEQVNITPKSKELWNLLEKIHQFRNISKPLMEIVA